jgi:hypothetical protein
VCRGGKGRGKGKGEGRRVNINVTYSYDALEVAVERVELLQDVFEGL